MWAERRMVKVKPNDTLHNHWALNSHSLPEEQRAMKGFTIIAAYETEHLRSFPST
jgi:hypothetical protein